MNIDKSKLKTFWYEDENGNIIDHDEETLERQSNAKYLVAEYPFELHERHIMLVKREDVDKCKHERKHIERKYGLKSGFVRRQCCSCGGTQVKKWWKPWGRKWDAYGSMEVFTGRTHISSGSEKLLLAMANSGDYTLSEAILVYARACERCSNVLYYKYTDGADGYAEFSEEWNKARTVCNFCKDENNKKGKDDENRQ